MTQLTGSIVALATPLLPDTSVDYSTLRKLIDWHIAKGTDCICVVGTTGESPTVSVQEHCEINQYLFDIYGNPIHHLQIKKIKEVA